MRRLACVLTIVTGLITLTCGCGTESAPKLDPEVAKQRRDAYESKMREGPPRGGRSGKK